MVIIFGPAGSGKSVQGQMLAEKLGWRWLSMGQLLRDSSDAEINKIILAGGLVSSRKTNEIIQKAIDINSNTENVILDGYPRTLDQAEWLVKNQPLYKKSIGVVIVLELDRSEIIKRLALRGRADDTPEVIDERLSLYKKEIHPILNYFTENNISISHIDGLGTTDQVHERIIRELESCNLV